MVKKSETPDMASIVAAVVAAMGQPATAATVAAPVASPQVPWIADAIKAQAATKATKAKEEAKPLIAVPTTVYPKCIGCDAHAPHGTTDHAYSPAPSKRGNAWEPFRALKVSNGGSGQGYKGLRDRVNAECLAAIVIWLGTPAGQAFQKTGVL